MQNILKALAFLCSQRVKLEHCLKRKWQNENAKRPRDFFMENVGV